jgi:hypothetical protein
MLKCNTSSLRPIGARPANFWIAVGWKFVGTGIIKSETKLDLIIGHETISAVSRPLDILNMCLISDVEV